MAKSYNHLKDMIEKQKANLKVRKNSECEVCGCFYCEIKLKIIDDIAMIICKECYMKTKETK
jgi:hypothetical protein